MLLLKNFYLNTTKGIDLINVSHEVRSVVKEAKGERGQVTVIVPLEGAGVIVLDKGAKMEGIRKDLESFRTNGLFRCLLSKSLVVPLEQGKMVIEPWQEIFLIDHEASARRREFKVQLFWEPKEGGEGGRQKVP